MDLVPVRGDAEAFHANWTAWGMIRDLLVELGCDVSEMAGSNDGDVVSAEVAAAWASAIDSGLDRIQVVQYKDTGFFSGLRTEWHVQGTASPVLLSSHDLVRSFVADMVPDGARNATPVSDVPPVVLPLADAPEDRAFIVGFAEFCRASGGFSQY